VFKILSKLTASEEGDGILPGVVGEGCFLSELIFGLFLVE